MIGFIEFYLTWYSAHSYRPALTWVECVGMWYWKIDGHGAGYDYVSPRDGQDNGCQRLDFINTITFLVESLRRKNGCNAVGNGAIRYVKAVLRKCLIWKAGALHAALSALLKKAVSAQKLRNRYWVPIITRFHSVINSGKTHILQHDLCGRFKTPALTKIQLCFGQPSPDAKPQMSSRVR